MNEFLKRLQEASAEAEQKAKAHKERRRAAGLQEAAGTGEPYPEIVLQTLETNESLPEDVDINDLERALQELENATLSKQSLGASRLGGLPDLPQSIEWPKLEDKLLPFIAQLNLADIPNSRMSALPNRGWLYVFGVFGDENDTVAVFSYDGDVSTLSRADRPASEKIWSDWCGTQFYSTVALTVVEGSADSVWDTCGGWLFGEMSEVFGTPGEEADRAMKDGTDWINLFAVTSVGNMQWSDAGHLYFLIRRSDLAMPDFSDVLGVIRSS